MTAFFASYFLLINLLAFGLMWLDKRRAVQHAWRIPESNLLFFCASGGFVGVFLAMIVIRHKTRHWQFWLAVALSALVWLAFMLFWAYLQWY